MDYLLLHTMEINAAELSRVVVIGPEAKSKL